MRRIGLVFAAVVVAGGVIACGSPEWASRTASCGEGEDNCVTQSKKRSPSTTQIGLPEPARPEDQEEPPPSEADGDAGAMALSNDDAGTSSPPSTSPSAPTLNASNACWSGTLSAWVEVNGCYQRKSDGIWFQCGFDTPSQSNLWFRNVVDGTGRFGLCSSLHPLP